MALLVKGAYEKATPEQIKITKEKLKSNSDNIIIEKSKVIAKLRNEVSFGYTTISTKKHLPNDINAIDQETWNQLGEVLQETMQKFESTMEIHDFQIGCELGEELVKTLKREKWEGDIPSFANDYSESELVMNVFPKTKLQKYWRHYRPIKKNNQFDGTMENERLAEKLRDPEAYYKKWNKISRAQLENQLDKLNKREQVYWIVSCGILLFVLVILVIKLVKIKRNES